MKKLAKKVCVPVQLDGKVGTEASEIDGLESGDYIEFNIENTHSSNILYLSMDGKQHWKRITAGKTISIKGTSSTPLRIKSEDWLLKADAADTTYEIFLTRIK